MVCDLLSWDHLGSSVGATVQVMWAVFVKIMLAYVSGVVGVVSECWVMFVMCLVGILGGPGAMAH
jgi:hypothetical protein